jgi:hypothetical protein
VSYTKAGLNGIDATAGTLVQYVVSRERFDVTGADTTGDLCTISQLLEGIEGKFSQSERCKEYMKQ